MQITQTPLYRMLAADEEIIFVVEDNVNVAGNFKVKFIAELYITKLGNATSLLLGDKVATLKVTPNNKGVGIFDFSRILESYVSPEYLGGETLFPAFFTTYNQINYSDKTPHSIHQIDEFSLSRNSVRNFAINFSIEFATTRTGTLTTMAGATSKSYYVHNAVRQEDDILAIDSSTGFFGYNYDMNNYVFRNRYAKFLTNCPSVQYIGSADFHTFAFFQESGDSVMSDSMYGYKVGTSGATIKSPEYFYIQFYYNASTTGSLITLRNGITTGGNFTNGTAAIAKIEFVGVGTGNIAASGSTVPANWDYYTVTAYDDTVAAISDTYYFYNQEVCKGFEKFRLTWLNRLGAWDYFNFTKKNVRQITSKREPYQQLKGSWNESIYKKYGYKGGRNTFSTNSKEVITLQTDFITEEAATWLEELFTSPDVFVLQEKSVDEGSPDIGGTEKNIINKYVQPCIIASSSYTRKTTANDKLKQYTLKIEMSHNKRIQKA